MRAVFDADWAQTPEARESAASEDGKEKDKDKEKEREKEKEGVGG
jgi:hypothetical protein